jgi:hypothetical protein
MALLASANSRDLLHFDTIDLFVMVVVAIIECIEYTKDHLR